MRASKQACVRQGGILAAALYIVCIEPTAISGVALRFPPQSKVAITEVSLDCGGNRRATPL